MEEEIAAELFTACKKGDADCVSRLIREKEYASELLQETHVPERGKKIGEKTIVEACSKGHRDIVRLLLNERINVNIDTSQGTPIFAAAKSGNLEIVKLLLEWGADFRRLRGGFSPVFIACVNGHVDVLKYLVKKAGLTVLNFDNPPLEATACTNGHLEVLKYLIDTKKTNVNRTVKGVDVQRGGDEKDSLLYIAASRRKTDIVDYLISKGAVVTKGTATKFGGIIKEVLLRRIKEVKIPENRKSPNESVYQAKWNELQLLELSPEVFKGINISLVKIDLRANSLSNLPTALFQIPTLEVLEVSGNQLKDLEGTATQWTCHRLQELDLSHNRLSTIPGDIFILPELTSLNLSNNLLTVLPGDERTNDDIQWTCEKLRKLDLNRNHFRSLPDNFQNLKNLKNLRISYNGLVELPISLCWNCTSLVSLDASHNELCDLPLGAQVFWMHSLESLHIAHNKLTEISQSITQLTRLNTLNLANNDISSLPPTNHWTCDRLVRLDLSYNRLTTLSHASMLDQTYFSPVHGSKPQKSQSGLLDRIFTIKPKPTPVCTQNSEDAVARELPHDIWAKCLQVLCLNNNDIQWLPDYMGNLTSLTKLVLNGNPKLETLPLTMGFLKNCWELSLKGLNLTGIPPHIRPDKATTKQLLAFLRAQKRQCKPYNRMKLMVVGLQGRGKTTLLSVLRDRTAPLPENISTVGVAVNEWNCTITKGSKRGEGPPQPVIFSTWDLAGQQVYYATHQCFLSRNTLYLAAWNMEKGKEEIENLRPWLLNIQARAPYSPVIIVGTHSDKLPSSEAVELKGKYRRLLERLYKQPGGGYPDICDIIEVSAKTKEGIQTLHEAIYRAAINAKDPDTKEKIIGQQVPASYIGLHKEIGEEVARRQQEGLPPVLTQEEFTKLTDRIPENDILDNEDLSLASQFLHDNGVLLHYNDHLRGLNNLYFIDPAWLCDMLAEVITVPERHHFFKNGILSDTDVAFLFRDTKKFPSQYLKQYLQLLERFEIALSLGDGTRLLPSMLSVTAPAFDFEQTSPEIDPSQLEKGDVGPPVCIRRRYIMLYVPSGFWSRLITRIMINLKRTGLMDTGKKKAHRDALYWRRGIYIAYKSGRFLVKAMNTSQTFLERSTRLVGDGVPEVGDFELQGLEVSVWSEAGDYSAIGYIVDQIESLVDEWFPGLKSVDHLGSPLIEREAVWVVPPHLSQKPRNEEEEDSVSVWSQRNVKDEEVVFSLHECALRAYEGKRIHNPEYNVYVPLEHLVPELLLTDLPDEFKMDRNQLEVNLDDYSTILGAGGAGAVYRGKYKGEQVAIKRFLTPTEAERIYEFVEQGITRPDPVPPLTGEEALQLYRDIRQEVTVLAGLECPYVVNLVGVSIEPLFITIELAPKGSLFGLLSSKYEAILHLQSERAVASVTPAMPGGVLGAEVTTRIALQVAMALSYLHEQGIVYRDLKADNVLVWSLELDQPINVKLADYGISRYANPGGVKGDEGTPGYMAPEALKRRGEDQAFDEKVDIFAYAMLLYEVMTGVRPFDDVENLSDINRLVSKGERPRLFEFNAEPAYPSMEELMYDCWKQLANDRPTAKQIISRLSEPGFMHRKYTITQVNHQAMSKIISMYALPFQEAPKGSGSLSVLMWFKQDKDRNYSILSADKGSFSIVEKSCEGGRVFCMTSTGEIEKRLWVGTADHEIQVYGQKNRGDPELLWTYSMKKGDAVLDLVSEVVKGRVTRVFASLANGCVLILYRKSILGATPDRIGSAIKRKDALTLECSNDEQDKEEALDWLDPLIMQVSESKKPPNCSLIVGNRLWCGCGNMIVVIDITKMEKIHEFVVFSNGFNLVYQLVSKDDKVWVRGRQFAAIMEYDAKTYKVLWKLNCEKIDPTGEVIRDKSNVDEEEKEDEEKFPEPATGNGTKNESQNGPAFSVEVEAGRLRGGFQPHNQTHTIRSLGRRRQRLQSIVISKDDIRARRHGGTRVTSLLLVKECLWIGRGMGDILIVDLSTGKVLARLTLDGTEAYGGKSNQSLALVDNSFVVAAQYLEPVAYREGGVARSTVPPHTQVTVWNALNKDILSLFVQRKNLMLEKGGVLIQRKE